MLSVLVPTLNESANLAACLAPLQAMRGGRVEIIVADGGSDDATATLAAPLADRVLTAPRGRAAQMNAAARAAQGDCLLFLHADCRLPPGAVEAIEHACVGSAPSWGRFDVRLDHPDWRFRVIETAMNWRSCISGIATGDQGIFVTRALFEQVGGYPEIPLMEDIALSRALKRHARPRCLRARMTVSARYWTQHGLPRATLRMWRLRAAFWLGADPQDLARRYYPAPTKQP